MEKVAVSSKEKMPISYQLVADVIPIGKSNAILLRDIATITSIPDNRNLYEIIEQLIVKYKYPIIASKKSENRGYFYPANEHELEEARDTLKLMITSLKKRHKALRDNYIKVGASNET